MTFNISNLPMGFIANMGTQTMTMRKEENDQNQIFATIKNNLETAYNFCIENDREALRRFIFGKQTANDETIYGSVGTANANIESLTEERNSMIATVNTMEGLLKCLFGVDDDMIDKNETLFFNMLSLFVKNVNTICPDDKVLQYANMGKEMCKLDGKVREGFSSLYFDFENLSNSPHREYINTSNISDLNDLSFILQAPITLP